MDIREKRRLIGVDYEIGPQRPLDAKLSGRFALFASPMRLQLRLLHEEDLTRLLDDLRQRASALVQVKRCAISRLPRNDTENGLRGLLQAECEIDWITLREVPGK